MIKNLNEDTALKFKNISSEEKEKKGILGRLYGNVASFAAPTRNGRKYEQSLWEQLFDSDLIKERFANGGIFGQLCHPEYEEIDMEKIACVMPEPPVKDSQGNLVAYVDLVDTPCGRIAYQLAKYGYKFGISSRGTGDITYNEEGEEIVDPDTYQLNAFDLVEIPAVESARLQFVESLDTKKLHGKTLKQKLSEEINNASDEDKEIMHETLKDLNIKLNENEHKYYTTDNIEVENKDNKDVKYVGIDDYTSAVIYKLNDRYFTDYRGKHYSTDDLDYLRDLVAEAKDNDEYNWSDLDEKLIDVPSVDLNQIKSQLNDIGFEIDKEGKTLFGNIHFQLKLKGSNFNAEDLRDYADRLHSFTEAWYESGVPITYNIGLDDKFNITCGMDIHKKSVPNDVDEQFYLNSEKDDSARQALRYNVDPDKLVTDLLPLLGHEELEKLCRKYDVTSDAQGKEKLGYNILTPDEMETKFGVRNLNGIKEELKDEDGWGETIPDNLEKTFEELESLMYEIRNARRGSYAKFGNKVSDLVNELNRLSDRLSTDADMIEIHQDELNETANESCSDKNDVDENEEAVNDGNEFVNQLQEALTKSAKLEKDNLSLQEKLSVCNAKEVKLREELAKCKKAMASLSESSKNSFELKESLQEKDNVIKSNTKLIRNYKSKLAAIKNDNSKQQLENSLNESKKQVEKLTNELNNSNKKLLESKKLVNKYVTSLKNYRDSYIKAQSQAYGISETNIRSNLKESYSIKDIDSICEKLSEHKSNMSKLPFRLNENVRIGFKNSENDYIKRGFVGSDDDIISENLLRMLDN